MGYEASLKKAWGAFGAGLRNRRIRFLGDEYEVDFSKKKILSLSRNIEAKDYYKILILHYLASENKIRDTEKDKWISFKELEGGKEYFPAFRKRTIEPILKKYGNDPALIFEGARPLGAEKMSAGSAAVSIEAFPGIRVGVVIWARDDDFSADCNILFNENIKKILPTEDVAVLGGIVAYSL